MVCTKGRGLSSPGRRVGSSLFQCRPMTGRPRLCTAASNRRCRWMSPSKWPEDTSGESYPRGSDDALRTHGRVCLCGHRSPPFRRDIILPRQSRFSALCCTLRCLIRIDTWASDHGAPLSPYGQSTGQRRHRHCHGWKGRDRAIEDGKVPYVPAVEKVYCDRILVQDETT